MSKLNFTKINRLIRQEKLSTHDIIKAAEEYQSKIKDMSPDWLNTLDKVNNCEHSFDTPVRHRIVALNISNILGSSKVNPDKYLFKKKCVMCGYFQEIESEKDYPEPEGFENSTIGEDILPIIA